MKIIQSTLARIKPVNPELLQQAQAKLDGKTKPPAQKDLLVSRGMMEKLLDDLASSIAEFDKTLEATRAGRRDHVGASADLRSVAAGIAEQVRLLDGLVRYRFGSNVELMGAWGSARNVAGPFRSKAEPEAGETPEVAKAVA